MKVLDKEGKEFFLTEGSLYLSSNLDSQKEAFLKRLEEADMVWALTRRATTGRCRKVMETFAEKIHITGPITDSYNKLTGYYGVFIPR